jgi:hypothetical protein
MGVWGGWVGGWVGGWRGGGVEALRVRWRGAGGKLCIEAQHTVLLVYCMLVHAHITLCSKACR